MTSKELSDQALEHQKQADELNRQSMVAYKAELKAQPIADRLVYAAYNRCPCGAGMAYDPAHEDESSVFVGALSGYWDCSAIILGTADQSVKHTAQLPFSFYNLKSEKQPSANGATTRPERG